MKRTCPSCKRKILVGKYYYALNGPERRHRFCRDCNTPMKKYHRNRLPSGRKVITVDGRTTTRARHLMQQHIGRPLNRNELVHHIDGDVHNDDIDNLMIVSGLEHWEAHWDDADHEI